MLISSQELREACQRSDIVQLEAWKKAGRLPPRPSREDFGLPDEFGAPRHNAPLPSLAVLQWLLAVYATTTPLDAFAKHAVLHGDLEMLQWIATSSGRKLQPETEQSLVRFAIVYNQLPVLQWLVASYAPTPDLTANDNELLRIAAEHSKLAVIKWLVLESGQAVDVTANRNQAVQLAALKGNLELVKWFVNTFGQAVDLSAVNNSALRWALDSQHFHVVRWILEESGQLAQILRRLERRLLDFLPDDLKRFTTQSIDMLQVLDKFEIPADEVNSYLMSPACRFAVLQQLVHSRQDLEKIRQRSPEASVRKM